MTAQSFHIPERYLRQIWKYRHFNTANLRTTDNRSIEIISVGTQNEDGGPDFRNAKINIGGVTYSGDIELHQSLEEWKEHSHHLNSKYNSVILHVVFQGSPTGQSLTKTQRAIPVLILEPYLTDAHRLSWQQMILNERAERLSTIKCYGANKNVEGTIIRKWIEKLAVERMELKVRRFEERLKELVDTQRPELKEPPARYDEIPFGLNPEDLPPPDPRYTQKDFSKKTLWEQLIYEGVMEALGYTKNQQPFLKLAKHLPLQYFKDISQTSDDETLLHYEAILFAAAGLLPSASAMNDAESKVRVHQLRQLGKEFSKNYRGELMTEAEWQFFRLRPENFPTVRLAGAARLVRRFATTNFFKTIIQTINRQEHLSDVAERTKNTVEDFQRMFIVDADDFWSTHYRFGERAGTTLTTLVGKSRANDIVINVVVPICLLYARIFREKDVRRGTIDLLAHLSPLSSNTITRTMEEQLVKKKFKLDSAMLHQGVLQLYKFYCVEERCGDCAVGKVVFDT
jgi:hypothetical protein